MISARNPPNPFHNEVLEWLEPPVPAKLELREDHAVEILRMNRSPDLPFRWSANPYRGCTHACAYCYARRTHEYLDHGAGEDFERILYYKPRAAELLAAAFEKRSWIGEAVNFSGVTDCYQPIERKLRLTRSCLKVCARYRNPVSIITRSPLVVRDLDILLELARVDAARVVLSIPLLDPGIVRALEPGAPPPSARFRAIEALASAGIPVGMSMSPMIPGLSDHSMPEVLRRGRDAGAQWATMGLLRLPGSVRAVFEQRLQERMPGRAAAVLDRLERHRGGSAFGTRMRGVGPEWEMSQRLFDQAAKRMGFGVSPRTPHPSPFTRGGQLGLFA